MTEVKNCIFNNEQTKQAMNELKKAIHAMVVMKNFENDLANYQKLKDSYQ